MARAAKVPKGDNESFRRLLDRAEQRASRLPKWKLANFGGWYSRKVIERGEVVVVENGGG